jgi:hypothetical protein
MWDDVYVVGLLPNIDLDRRGQAAVNRGAISRTCVASGFLHVRKKRFVPVHGLEQPR